MGQVHMHTALPRLEEYWARSSGKDREKKSRSSPMVWQLAVECTRV